MSGTASRATDDDVDLARIPRDSPLDPSDASDPRAPRPTVLHTAPSAEATVLAAHVRRQAPPSRWAHQYATALAVTDLGVVLLATSLGYFLRFGTDRPETNQQTYLLVGSVVVVTWMCVLFGVAAYEVRHMTSGSEEFKRVIRGTAWTAGIVGLGCYLLSFDVARGFVAVVFPLGLVLLIVVRYVIRRIVAGMRQDGLWVYRLVAVGTTETVEHLLTVTRPARLGLRVVAACVSDAPVGSELAPGVPVVGGLREAAAVAAEIDADVVAVTGTALGPRGVRELGWALEGTGRGLVMAPGLTEVAGPRVHVSPVEGLPLMWVEQPQFTGLARVVKRALDIVGSTVLLVLASPLLVATAIAVTATSRGPVLFRQSRLGTHGTEFDVWKFRSMYAGAEAQRDDLLHRNEQDGGGVLFKIARDPRVTPVGRWLRRLSIDELPQLVNVLRGQMSLVGPRPLATADSTYSGAARRRLLVRPGMTGLWQVSGRSDLSWEDAVRLDLYYVENWSLTMDIAIILRTVWIVLRRSGAY